jgi:hypothetical protein
LDLFHITTNIPKNCNAVYLQVDPCCAGLYINDPNGHANTKYIQPNCEFIESGAPLDSPQKVVVVAKADIDGSQENPVEFWADYNCTDPSKGRRKDGVDNHKKRKVRTPRVAGSKETVSRTRATRAKRQKRTKAEDEGEIEEIMSSKAKEVAEGQNEDEGEIDATALKGQLANTDTVDVDLTEKKTALPVPHTVIANPNIAARAADEIMATHISLEPASSSKVEKPALVAPRHSTSSSSSKEKLAMANRAELSLMANEAVKVYKEQTSSVLNMATVAATTAAIAALAPRPSIIVNPMVAKMEALATVVETNCARKLGTPKPKTTPPTRQSARVKGRGATEMNDSDASDNPRFEDPDNLSDEDSAEGESD